MAGYYEEKLSGERLKKCYELAPPRVNQYLEAEINFALSKIKADNSVLELGCGYGRIIRPIARKAKQVTGIDTSRQSIELGKKMLKDFANISLFQMNALKLDFENDYFDVVLCIQNGISAFHVNQADLIEESIRVTKPGGLVLFSSYSGKFWKHRLEWFKIQSEAGLLGEIDYKKTGDGVIICKDGFTASTINEEQFKELTTQFESIKVDVMEVDESSIFCIISPEKKR
jgi:ubiquinone/menaquinone biosynthesis C-methylase UbiE